LQAELKEFGVNFDKMKVIVGETKNTLEADIALVPSTSYTLYLYPIKVKAGSERTDLFDKIKAWVGGDETRKQKFIVDGNNMTRLSTDVLKKLAAEHIGGTAVAPASAEEKPKAPKASTKAKDEATKQTVADVVQSVAAVKGEGKEALEEAVDKAKAAYKKAVAADVDEETQDMLLEKLTKAQQALRNFLTAPPSAPKAAAPEPPKETPAQIAAREAKAAEEKRKADKKIKLEQEAKGLKGHLSGIN
jgi:hypothetical protein